MHSKCINSICGRKSVTGNGFSDIVTIYRRHRHICNVAITNWLNVDKDKMSMYV